MNACARNQRVRHRVLTPGPGSLPTAHREQTAAARSARPITGGMLPGNVLFKRRQCQSKLPRTAVGNPPLPKYLVSSSRSIKLATWEEKGLATKSGKGWWQRRGSAQAPRLGWVQATRSTQFKRQRSCYVFCLWAAPPTLQIDYLSNRADQTKTPRRTQPYANSLHRSLLIFRCVSAACSDA